MIYNYDNASGPDNRTEFQPEAYGLTRDENEGEENKNPRNNRGNDYGENRDRDYDQDSGEYFDINCCEKHERKEYKIYVPVSVKPYAHLYRPETNCENETRVEHGRRYCENEREEFEFTFEQTLCVDVPIKYGTIVHYYKPFMEEEN